MNKTVILTIAVLTGLLVLGFNFDEVFSAEPAPSGPVPIPYPVTTKAIPDWVRNNFEWYVDGQIDEKTLLTSMNWMFDNNVMHLSEKAAIEVAELRVENKKLHEQVVQYRESDLDFTSRMADESIPEGEQFSAGGGADLKEMLSPFKNNLGALRELVANAPVSDNYRSDAEFQKATDVWENDLKSTSSTLESDLDRIPANTDINAFVQAVLRESYMEQTELLKDYAAKVKFYNSLKKEIRDSLQNARETTSEFAGLVPGHAYTVLGTYVDENGDEIVVFRNPWGESETDEEIYPDKYGTIDTRLKTLEPTTTTSKDLSQAFDPYIVSLDEMNVEMITQNVMMMSIQQAEEEAKDLALEIEENNRAKADLRETITYLRELAADPNTSYPISVRYYDTAGNAVKSAVNSAKEATLLADKLESTLATMSDMSQMMQLELQDAMNKQSQAMQTLSNIMKSQHDTLKAIISNMRG